MTMHCWLGQWLRDYGTTGEMICHVLTQNSLRICQDLQVLQVHTEPYLNIVTLFILMMALVGLILVIENMYTETFPTVCMKSV